MEGGREGGRAEGAGGRGGNQQKRKRCVFGLREKEESKASLICS